MIFYSAIETNSAIAAKLVGDWATAPDREYAARKKKPGAEQNSLLGRALLRRLLGDKSEILIAENGKPYIKNGPHISVSHSHQMVAAAICHDFPLGIDIEYHRPRDFAKLATYAFGPEENKLAVDAAGFYQIWTMREAIAKISGESMFAKMNGQDIDAAKWMVFHKLQAKDYTLAVAVENQGARLEWVDPAK